MTSQATVLAALLAASLIAVAALVATLVKTRRARRDALVQAAELRAELNALQSSTPTPTPTSRVLDVAGSLMKASVGFVADRLLRDDIQRYADREQPLTVMFSDLANSTALNVELGDQAFSALIRRHDQVTGEIVTANDGKVLKRLGDGFMAVFTDAAKAVAAAQSIRQRLSDAEGVDQPLRVRIGLHTSLVVSDRGDLFGEGIATTARIASLAEPGEVLLSAQTWAAADEPPSGPVREVELDDLPGPHRVCSLNT